MSGVLDLRTVDPPAGAQLRPGPQRARRAGVEPRAASPRSAAPGSSPAAAAPSTSPATRSATKNPRFWDVLGKAELATGRRPGERPRPRGGRRARASTRSRGRLRAPRRTTTGAPTAGSRTRRRLGERLLVETVGSWAEIRRRRAEAAAATRRAASSCADRRDLEVLGARAEPGASSSRRGTLPRWGWEARRYDASFDYAKQPRPGRSSCRPLRAAPADRAPVRRDRSAATTSGSGRATASRGATG